LPAGGVSLDLLTSRRTTRSRLGRISVRRVARRLGRDDSSFVRPIARLERSLDSDAALRDQVDRIIRDLTKPDPSPKSANQD
jgi:hypothetical protein